MSAVVPVEISVVPVPPDSVAAASQSEMTAKPHDPAAVAVYAIGIVVEVGPVPLLDVPTVGCPVSVTTTTFSAASLNVPVSLFVTVTVIAADDPTGAVKIAAWPLTVDCHCASVYVRCEPRLSVIDGAVPMTCVSPDHKTTSREFAGV
jgi:hypothetical protein